MERNHWNIKTCSSKASHRLTVPVYTVRMNGSEYAGIRQISLDQSKLNARDKDVSS